MADDQARSENQLPFVLQGGPHDPTIRKRRARSGLVVTSKCRPYGWLLVASIMLFLSLSASSANQLQCPNDIDKEPTGNFPGSEDVDHNGDGTLNTNPNIKCMWIQGGDGFARMADGYTIYGFSFGEVPLSKPENQAQSFGTLGANFPAPLIFVNQGQELYLNLGNTGFVYRPDVDDPHSIHWHGFPEQSAIHDGVPEVSIGTKIGTIFGFYYKATQPGTYFYHCHVEAPEHIQLGMIGNLYVRPSQNGTNINFGGRIYNQFAYNDGNGVSGYNVEAVIQISDFDRYFHDQFFGVQPDPFYGSKSSYPLVNGRGYPDTTVTGPIFNDQLAASTQTVHSVVTAQVGQRILLRLSNVSTNAFHTVQVLGIPMIVVGKDAKLLRGPTGLDMTYRANSVTFGGGESYDVILDTLNVPQGTYFLYSRNLNDLSNYQEDRGGLMTEIRVTAP